MKKNLRVMRYVQINIFIHYSTVELLLNFKNILTTCIIIMDYVVIVQRPFTHNV